MSPLIAIVGETASGKSALGLELAEKFGGEIICADSRTIYKGMDIGTAKPTGAERARVPHHLVDVVNPDEHFSAARFKELAQAAIDDVSARGKLPILVGGTGLYVDSVLFDYEFRAPADSAERNRLQAMSVEDLQTEIVAKGFAMPENWQNKRHLTRLLEADGAVDVKKPLRENTLVLGLEIARNRLKGRITSRVEHMVELGLEVEVRALVSKYGWQAEGMNGIGYREWQEYVSGTQNLADTAAQIVKDTLALAKRQRTWFRRNASVQWLPDRSNAVGIVTTFLNK
jgi:tRNA dimethylallyltransferase